MKSSRQNGFTLIEVLLGISIFSIIAMAVYGTFSGGIRVSHHAGIKNQIYREARWTFDLMARELENMVPYDFSNSYTDRTAFMGSSDEIKFILPTGDGLKVITYALLEPEWGSVHQVIIGRTYQKNVDIISDSGAEEEIDFLVRREMDFADYLAGNTDQKEEIISSHVQRGSLEFQFGYYNQETNERFWEDTWQNNYIPSNILIKINFVSDSDNSEVIKLQRKVLVSSGFWGVRE